MTTDNTDNTDEPTKAELHDRVKKLESTVGKLMPSRRDALRMGAAGIAGAAGLAGAASQSANASTGSAGDIGDPNNRADLFADTVDANQLTVNNGPTKEVIASSSGTIQNISNLNAEYNIVDLFFDGLYGGSAGSNVTLQINSNSNTIYYNVFEDGTTATQNKWTIASGTFIGNRFTGVVRLTSGTIDPSTGGPVSITSDGNSRQTYDTEVVRGHLQQDAQLNSIQFDSNLSARPEAENFVAVGIKF